MLVGLFQVEEKMAGFDGSKLTYISISRGPAQVKLRVDFTKTERDEKLCKHELGNARTEESCGSVFYYIF